jgi:NAD synthase
MLVTTGNKSEMSVGYATIYGDMNGGFNPIKDLYKMEVFRLAELRNRWKSTGALGPGGEVIARNILTKPPSAELRENQKDQDSLPPYDVLDAILEGLVEKEMRVADVVALGHDIEIVRKIERLLYLAEYKRRQSAPGVKVTRKNFGRDRRYPIVNWFRDPGVAATPGIPAPPTPSNETRRPAVPMPGNPPLSLFDARFLLAHGHFIAVPNELIGDPGVDVDDREHQIAEDEEQGHAPREMPPVQTREKRFRTVPGERYAERRGGHVYIQHRSGIAATKQGNATPATISGA